MSQAVITHKRAPVQIEETATAIPPELLLRKDNSIRYERGGTVYATDGRVGILSRVVVDEGSAEVVDLVVDVDGGRTVLVPPDLVDKTAGSAVFLTANRTQFSERATDAQEYVKAMFGGCDPKVLQSAIQRVKTKLPRRGVAQIGANFVETPANSQLERLERRATG